MILITIDKKICYKCDTLSVTIHGAKHYQIIVFTLHLNTHYVPHDWQETMMEACYNAMWEGLF